MDNRFLGIIEQSFKNNWELPALSDNDETACRYSEVARSIGELHALFITLGVKKGDRIAIYGRNSVNWGISFFATLSYGAIATTILSDFNPEAARNIIEHSEAKVLLVNQALYDKLDVDEMPYLESVISLDDFSLIVTSSQASSTAYLETRKDFVAKYKDGFNFSDMYFHTEQADEMAILNYTSGTTSSPKGVMIPYRSLWSNTRHPIDHISYIERGVNFVSCLPMGHMYGLAFELILGIAIGAHIHFLTRIPSPQYVLGTFKTYKPPMVCIVPLILEKIVKSMILPGLKGRLPQTAEQKKEIKDNLINIFGGNIKQVCIAGAALSKDTSELLTSVGFPYTVGYGMTECATLITLEDYKQFVMHSCGKTVDRMEVRIDSEDPYNVLGELHTRGTNVMLGYYKNEEATQAAFTEDGWLRTGDLALMDSEGNYFIKGRCKTMILGSSGHNIYPEEIEELFNALPHVVESLVVEKGNKLVALVYPDQEIFNLENIKEKLNILIDEMKESINKRLPSYSHISQIILRFEEFEKTPKRSIRRFLYQ